ncbi:MAG: ATP-binding protein [Planctomycetota bacterium]|nr:MAG: ATP-binding protein [Planctomycetota bacterium]
MRDRLREWLAGIGWAKHDVADVVLAVDEALTNVIRHGYQEQPDQDIHLTARTLDDATLGSGVEIVIRDFGRQVPLEKICGRDLDDLRPGGLGVHIIRNVMDYAEYSHAEGGGMRLCMRKFPTQKKGQADNHPVEAP